MKLPLETLATRPHGQLHCYSETPLGCSKEAEARAIVEDSSSRVAFALQNSRNMAGAAPTEMQVPGTPEESLPMFVGMLVSLPTFVVVLVRLPMLVGLQESLPLVVAVLRSE